MGIKATCHCGAQFTAKAELAGRTVKCPKCGQAFQVPAAAPRTGQAVNKITLVSIVLSSLVLAIIGIAAVVFLSPSKSGYKTPESAWKAQKDAAENQDWETLYNTLTPDSFTMDRWIGGSSAAGSLDPGSPKFSGVRLRSSLYGAGGSRAFSV